MTIISYNHRLIYIHIPKCGGSSVEIEFERGIKWGDFVVGSTRFGEILHANVFLPLYGIYKHNSVSELKRILGEDSFSTFEVVTTVREPIKIVESYYKFSKTVLSWIAAGFQQRTPDASEAYALAWAADQIRTGALENRPVVVPLNMLRGTVRAGALASSFEEYLAAVADDRWLGYLKSQTHDEAGARLVQAALKLEEPETVDSYFSTRLGRPFRIGHANPSRAMQIVWPVELKRRYYDLLAEDYETFGYTPAKPR